MHELIKPTAEPNHPTHHALAELAAVKCWQFAHPVHPTVCFVAKVYPTYTVRKQLYTAA
jgi:hypothetical protein